MIRLRKINESYSVNEFYEPSDGCEFDGFYVTKEQLTEIRREAWEAGYQARVYIASLLEGNRSAFDKQEAFSDYLSSKSKEGEA